MGHSQGLPSRSHAPPPGTSARRSTTSPATGIEVDHTRSKLYYIPPLSHLSPYCIDSDEYRKCPYRVSGAKLAFGFSTFDDWTAEIRCDDLEDFVPFPPSSYLRVHDTEAEHESRNWKSKWNEARRCLAGNEMEVGVSRPSMLGLDGWLFFGTRHSELRRVSTNEKCARARQSARALREMIGDIIS